jgi:Domain of unknown function (DUF305)
MRPPINEIRLRWLGAAALLTICACAVLVAGMIRSSAAPGIDSEGAFLAENDAAMKQMMAGMSITPTGDIDRDFVAMMIPHHQGAIDMARALLLSGKNETVRRLAQEIIVTQEDEIRAMRLAVGVTDAASALSPVCTAPTPKSEP